MATKSRKAGSIRNWMQRNGRFISLIVGIVVIGAGVRFGYLLFKEQIWSNLFMEVLSVTATVLIIDVLNRWRDEQQTRVENQARLLREARSPVASVAITAIEELRDMGLLCGENSIFACDPDDRVNLRRANLAKADLSDANFTGVDLSFANLRDANFRSSNIEQERSNLRQALLIDSDMIGANFTNADLTGADLTNAQLSLARLDGAILRGAILKGAILDNASLIGADISDAIFDEQTVLPDTDEELGQYDKFWNTTIDMTVYTRPVAYTEAAGND